MRDYIVCEWDDDTRQVPIMELSDRDLDNYLRDGFIREDGDPDAEALWERLRIEKVRRNLGL